MTKSSKRRRAGTPEKDSVASEIMQSVSDDYNSFCLKVKQDMEKVGTKSVKELKDGMERMFTSSLFPFLERQVNHISGLAAEIVRLESELECREVKEEEQVNRIAELEKFRETSDVK